MAETIQWSPDPGDLQLGLRASSLSLRGGETVQLTLSVRNRGTAPVTLAPYFALMLRRGDTVDEHGSGPRAIHGEPLAPGETRDVLGWQLNEDQLGPGPGERVVWVVYRPGDGAELRSGDARIAVIG
jgi:hypothetical protein